MCLVGTGWSVYAQRATDDSFGRLGGHLPPDAISALSAMDTLNMVVAVLNAILALALVGGIMLLRRKPAGRMVVAVAASFLAAGAVRDLCRLHPDLEQARHRDERDPPMRKSCESAL